MNNYEAFVYKWTKTDGFWYIGFHKGSIDDGYISSGEYFLPSNLSPDGVIASTILFPFSSG